MFDRRKNHSWYRILDEEIQANGGLMNAHLHLDRAGTLEDKFLEQVGHKATKNSHISLLRKHSMISDLHNGLAYSEENFNERLNAFLEDMAAVNTFRADTLVDVTKDGLELTGVERMLKIKQAWEGRIDLRLGSYTPLGFIDSEPERWELFVEGARKTDFIAALPEADDVDDYPDHIGFSEHCRRTLQLAQELGKYIHVHTDQRNEPTESGTERLIEACREVGIPESKDGEPSVWAIHLISPSTYDEARFNKMVEGMLEFNIGLITCPSAALGMRMYRPVMTPTYNSIPRVLEMLSAGVQVRVGSDNICDICSPSTTADLVDELYVLSASLRFYDPVILACLGAGKPLSAEQREFIKDHLDKNDKEIAKFMSRQRK